MLISDVLIERAGVWCVYIYIYVCVYMYMCVVSSRWAPYIRFFREGSKQPCKMCKQIELFVEAPIVCCLFIF